MTETEYWNQKLYCGLRPDDVNDVEDTDVHVAFRNEFPHTYDTSSFTNYVFVDGNPGTDHTYGPYIGVTISKSGPNFNFSPCAYDTTLRQCTAAAYNALPSVTCSPATPGSPFP
jgi:hypothetical protein